MLKDIIKKIDSAIPSLYPVDTTRFNDPVANQTGWKQVRAAKTSRASNKLIEGGPDQLVYKPSIGGRIMGVVFVLMGSLAVAMYFMIRRGGGGVTVTSGSGDPIVLALFGLLFIAVGVLVFFLATSPVVFDKKLGMFYVGRKQRNNPDATNAKHSLRFTDIHAIQLLSRIESNNNNNNNNRSLPRFYKVHDLNLVKHDGERLFVVTYSKVDRAREDAAKIGAFVNVPVWDGSDDGAFL